MTKPISSKHPRTSTVTLLAAAAAFVASVTGCSTTQREQMKSDTPWSYEKFAQRDICARDEEGRLRTFKSKDESCYALVRASDWYSTTNLHVSAGWVLEIEVPDGQMWFDASRINTAPVGDRGNFMMRLFGGLKRHDEPYFALMSNVVTCQAEIADKPGARQCNDVGASKSSRILKSGHKMYVPATGELAFYVNDAVFPIRWKDMFYWNNKGQVWVRITLIAKD